MMDYKVDVPVGESGSWRIERFAVTEKDAEWERMRMAFGGGRHVPVGRYTRLMRGGRVIMSDTPDEIRDHMGPIRQVEVGQRCLVHGLGIGMIARALLIEGAGHVTVVEKSPDVIKLTAPWLRGLFGDRRIDIIEGDALTWKPEKGARWAVVWHDIWDNICSDNLPEMKKLHRRFGRRSDWQGSWARWQCERQAKY